MSISRNTTYGIYAEGKGMKTQSSSIECLGVIKSKSETAHEKVCHMKKSSEKVLYITK